MEATRGYTSRMDSRGHDLGNIPQAPSRHPGIRNLRPKAGEPSGENHWDALAAQWRLFGPPLRPSPEDLDFFRESLREFGKARGGGPHHALLLGVTPEYARFDWPEGTTLTALDHSVGMIRAVWPGANVTSERVLCGNWLEAPLAPQSFDTIVGDGVLSVFPFPAGYRGLASAIERVARPGAMWNLRLYCRPERAESTEQVFGDLVAGKIGSFHAFKWRLAMAIHGDDDARGVGVADVWRRWDDAMVDVQRLVERGWSPETIRMIDAYRDAPARYSFPSLDAVIEVLREFCEPRRVGFPAYELGDRCPSVTLQFPS